MKRKILQAVNKFNLNLSGKVVLTEAASGNYVVTPVIAALAGAKVFAVTKESFYASISEVKEQTYFLAKVMGVENRIEIVEDESKLDYSKFDIVTNTGFVRPINKNIIFKLKRGCVIPLMWEPWEYRKEDLDLDACVEYGIKVYGTNESDSRLKTMDYIGYIVLNKLLEKKLSPFSANLLIIGSGPFVKATKKILNNNGYRYESLSSYEKEFNDLDKYNAIVVLEHRNPILLIGRDGVINDKLLNADAKIIHICGNVLYQDSKCEKIPNIPAQFGHMSFTADYVDSQAVIDLHSAGLKVAEGMLKANESKLDGKRCKEFMESNYPALAFDDSCCW